VISNFGTAVKYAEASTNFKYCGWTPIQKYCSRKRRIRNIQRERWFKWKIYKI